MISISNIFTVFTQGDLAWLNVIMPGIDLIFSYSYHIPQLFSNFF